MIIFGGRGGATSDNGSTYELLADEWEVDLHPSETLTVATNRTEVGLARELNLLGIMLQ